VGIDRHPDVGRQAGGLSRSARDPASTAEIESKGECQPGRRADDELASGDVDGHGYASPRAARSTARTMRPYVPQRQRLPFMACTIWARVGLGVFAATSVWLPLSMKIMRTSPEPATLIRPPGSLVYWLTAMDIKGLTGAETLLRVLAAMGVERIFASPGSEWAPIWEHLAKPYGSPHEIPRYLSSRGISCGDP